MKGIYLLLGSNKGDRVNILRTAREKIAAEAGRIITESSLYETEPWGFADPIPFINQVVEIDSDLEPDKLLTVVMEIERQLGRIRMQEISDFNLPQEGPANPQSTSVQEAIAEAFSGGGCSCGPAGGSATSYSSRTLDIDILFHGSRLVFTNRLMLPHPRLHERRFTLMPLKEIAPALVHPVLKKTIAELADLCTDSSRVTRI